MSATSNTFVEYRELDPASLERRPATSADIVGALTVAAARLGLPINGHRLAPAEAEGLVALRRLQDRYGRGESMHGLLDKVLGAAARRREAGSSRAPAMPPDHAGSRGRV